MKKQPVDTATSKVIGTTIESHPVALTDPEKLSRGLELARERAAVEQAEAKKAALMSECKSEIDSHAGAAALLARVLNEGREYRPVDVDQIHIFDENRVTYVRRDTGEIVRERPMTFEERQRELPLQEPTPSEK